MLSEVSAMRMSPAPTHASSEHNSTTKIWPSELNPYKNRQPTEQQQRSSSNYDKQKITLDTRSYSIPNVFQYTQISKTNQTESDSLFKTRDSLDQGIRLVKFKKFEPAQSRPKIKNGRKIELAKLETKDVRELIIEDQQNLREQLENIDSNLKSHQYIDNAENLRYYRRTYKIFSRLQEQGQLYDMKQNLQMQMCQSVEKNNLLPKKLGVFQKQSKSINGSITSKPYVNLFSEALSNPSNDDLRTLKLNSNHLDAVDLEKICKNIPKTVQHLDIRDNNLKRGAKQFGALIETRNLRFKTVDFENNKLSMNVNPMLKTLTSVYILNLSKNSLGDGCIESLIKLTQNGLLQELYLHYNHFIYMGPFFKAIQRNNNLKVLDFSFNRLCCPVEIAQFLGKPHPELIHFDLSYNRLSHTDLLTIQSQLIFNDILIGLHIEGNTDGFYVNSRGFLVQDQEIQAPFPNYSSQSLQSSQISIMDVNQFLDDELPIKEIERKIENQESKKQKPQFHRRIKSINILGNRKEDNILSDVCWICEGWTQIKFTWTPDESGSIISEPIFLHLDFDSFRPMIMTKVDNIFVLNRMCPPARKIEYFYSNPMEDVQTYARDQKTHETGEHSQLRNFGVFLQYSDGTICESRPMRVVNFIYSDKPFQVVSPDSYIVNTQCQIRQPELVYEIDKVAAHKRKWRVESSFFKDFDPDNQIRMNECLNQDLSMIKQKIDDQLVEVLQKHYSGFLQLFYYYSSLQPNYSFPRIRQQVAYDFVQSCEFPQRGLVKQVDLDLIFISSQYLNRRENYLFQEEKSLVRHQFLDFVIRISREAYLNKKQSQSLAEAVDRFLSWQCSQFSPAQEWRNQRYWIQIMDITIKYKFPLLQTLFKIARNQRAQYLSPQDYILFLEKCGIVSDRMTASEAYMIYLQSMMTQVETLNDHRQSQMSIYEFIESLARLAEKLSIVSSAYKIKKINMSQRRVLPLFVKFEGFLQLLFVQLELNKTTTHAKIANSTVLKTRQVRKLGFECNSFIQREDRQSDSSEEDDSDEESKKPSLMSIDLVDVSNLNFAKIRSEGSNEEIASQNDTVYQVRSMDRIEYPVTDSVNSSSERFIQKKAVSTPNRAQLRKRAIKKFGQFNFLKEQNQLQIDAEMQERAEQEESSPLQAQYLKKEKAKIGRISKEFTLQMQKFQFDGDL